MGKNATIRKPLAVWDDPAIEIYNTQPINIGFMPPTNTTLILLLYSTVYQDV